MLRQSRYSGQATETILHNLLMVQRVNPRIQAPCPAPADGPCSEEEGEPPPPTPTPLHSQSRGLAVALGGAEVCPEDPLQENQNTLNSSLQRNEPFRRGQCVGTEAAPASGGLRQSQSPVTRSTGLLLVVLPLCRHAHCQPRAIVKRI